MELDVAHVVPIVPTQTMQAGDGHTSRSEIAATGEDMEGGFKMDWQAKYLEKLGQDIADLRMDVRQLDDRLSTSIERLSSEVTEVHSVLVTRSEFHSRMDQQKDDFMNRMSQIRSELLERMDRQKDELLARIARQKDELAERIARQKDELVERMDLQKAELVDKIEQQGAYLNDKIEQQGIYLIHRIDQQGDHLADRIDQQRIDLCNKMDEQDSLLGVRMDRLDGETKTLRQELHTTTRWVIGTVITMIIGFATLLMRI